MTKTNTYREIGSASRVAVAQAKRLIHEGNQRRLIVEHDERTVAQVPLTLGVVGALIAPALAVGAGIVALATHSTVSVRRNAPTPAARPDPTAGDCA